jgi:hypothetical protein
MDILAHALWVGVGTTLASRRLPLSRRTIGATIALSVLPDIVQVLPIAAWVVFGEGKLATLVGYAFATPGTDPVLPAAVALWTYHLHCVMHSAVVAGGATLLLWTVARSLRIPLLGWWSHIVIDVFTHSATFYPVPVLYPFTMRGFDGIAWNSPWFLALNYGLLGVAFVYLMRTRRDS